MILSVIQSGDTNSARGDVTPTRQLLFRSIGTTPRTSSFDPITHTQSLITTRPSGACPDTRFHRDQRSWVRPRARAKQQKLTWLQSWSTWLIHTGRIVAGFFICSLAGVRQVLTDLQKEIRQLEKEIEQADTTKLAPPLSETELIQQLVCHWNSQELAAEADLTAGPAIFTTRWLRGHSTGFRPRNTIRKAISLFRSQRGDTRHRHKRR